MQTRGTFPALSDNVGRAKPKAKKKRPATSATANLKALQRQARKRR